MRSLIEQNLDFFDLKRLSEKETLKAPSVRVTLLGDSSTQLFSMALRGAFQAQGCHLDIYEGEFDQIESEILRSESGAYRHKPEHFIIWFSARRQMRKFYQADTEARKTFAEDFLQLVERLLDSVEQHSGTPVIMFNLEQLDDGVFGNFANSLSQSLLYQLRSINLRLMELAQRRASLRLFDFESITRRLGGKAFHPQMYYHADAILDLKCIPEVACRLADSIHAIRGSFKKCLILDLDNTLYGGVIGDDGLGGIVLGPEGPGKPFHDLQRWCLELKRRGILLAVCSKNTESIAKEVFERHPEMILKLEDISIFVANWENKAVNIRNIQRGLNIGFDSMVFLDDNPAERELIHQQLPEVTIPELPEDPAEYLFFLQGLGLFETASHSDEDADRTKKYRNEHRRAESRSSFESYKDYLRSLEMEATFGSVDEFSAARVAQLSQRSNQFNLRTIRYSESEITSMVKSPDYLTQYFRLKDRFGDHGVISAVILEVRNAELFIDTWIMSCRVLGRGVEELIIQRLLELLKESGKNALVGEYLPTKKNVIVEDLYERLGFKGLEGLWRLEANCQASRSHEIQTGLCQSSP